MKDIYIYEFGMESVIPGIRNAIAYQDVDDIIELTVKRADRDALTGGRFN